MKIAYVHFLKTGNTGDRMSGPYHYFKLPMGKLMDVRKDSGRFDVAIYGGGALAQCIGSNITARKRIAWGIGRTSRAWREGDPIPAMPEMDLLGCREFGIQETAKVKYIPCASCMHSAFDRQYSEDKAIVAFYNAGRKPRIPNAHFAMSNREPMQDIIAFLGSAALVVTNSYHGAYWATLLGKRVIVHGPYSSKFHFMKYPPTLVPESEDWRDYLHYPVRYPEALADARSRNLEFNRMVNECLL